MAENYQVGDLKIIFEALDKTDKDFQNLANNLEKISKSILAFTKENIANIPLLGNRFVKLSNVISSIDLTGFGDKVQHITDKLQPLLSSINNAGESLIALSNIMQTSKSAATAAANAVGKIKKNAEEAAASTKDLADGVEDAAEATEDAAEATEDAAEGMEDAAEKTKKSKSLWEKLTKSIARIALYRTIRRGLQLITGSARDSIQAFAKVDDTVNNTMSSITSSLQVISLSAGSILIPLLEAIQPILSEIAQGAADFANSILQATATGDTYWAINAKAIQSYREQLQESSKSLASFDKINTLNGKSGNSIFLEKKEVDKSSNAVKHMQARIESIKNIISELWNIIQQGWNQIIIPLFDMISPYFDGFIAGISIIISHIGEIIKKVQDLSFVEPVLKGILAGVTALFAAKIIKGIQMLFTGFNAWAIAVGAVATTIGILSNWDNFDTEAKRTITIVSGLIAAFTGLAAAILAARGAESWGTAIPLIITSIAAGTVAVKGLIDGIQAYANGGVPSKGSLFWAGEAGAETVTVGSNGRTEVTNVSQMENALYNAIIRANKQGEVSKQPINLYIDGRKILEATQKSAHSQGLDFRKI